MDARQPAQPVSAEHVPRDAVRHSPGDRVQEGTKWSWLLYDCGKNAWFGVDLGGNDPITRGSFNNSMGLMYDPGRKLVWAVGQNSEVYVLRVDFKTARLSALK